MKNFIIFILLALFGLEGLHAQKKITGPIVGRQDENIKPVGIRLTNKDTVVTVSVGEEFWYSAKTYGSIGKYYKLDYDEDAFEVKRTTHYYYPESVTRGMCGKDEGVEISIFKPLKQGQYPIKVICMDKTKVKKIITYTIIVI